MGLGYQSEKIYPIKDYLKNEDFIQNQRIKKIQKHKSKESKNFVLPIECRFFKLCKYCTLSFSNECCLKYNLKFSNFPKECQSCYNLDLCQRANENKISENEIPDIKKINILQYNVKNPEYELKHNYIPKIDIHSPKLRKEQIKVIKSCKIKILNVSLQKIMSPNENELIKREYLVDLHELLNFSGRILLTTNIQDKFCEKIMQNIPKFIEQVNLMNVDVITTIDANFYWNQPLFITLLRLKDITIANRKINEMNCSQIGLVPPMIPVFTKKYMDFMLKANFKVIGIPMQEINKDNERGIKSKIFHTANSIKNYKTFKLLLISTSPIKASPKDLIFPDYYASLTWTFIKNSKLLSNEIINQKRKQKLHNYKEIARSNKNEIKNTYNIWW